MVLARLPLHCGRDTVLTGHVPVPGTRTWLSEFVDVCCDEREREHHAVVPASVRLAVRAKKALALEAGAAFSMARIDAAFSDAASAKTR